MSDKNESVVENTVTGKTSVFLAWSGSVSKKMAGLLKEYLPLLVRNIDIFMSEDTTKGKRWHSEIANVLGSTKFGILCLTPENLTSEWIHFEAGALSKTIDDATHVCPLLLDVKKSELQEPLASFQATIFNKEEFKSLVNDLAQACGDSLKEGQFDRLMDALWPDIDKSIKKLNNELAESRKKSGEPKDTKPKTDPLLEEVLVRVREQGRLLAALTEQGGSDIGKEIMNAVFDLKMTLRRTMKNMRPEIQSTFFDEQGPVFELNNVKSTQELDEWFRLWLDRGKDTDRLFSYIEESAIPSGEIQRLKEAFKL